MAEERQKENWWHTAATVAEIRNLFAKNKVFPADCHPMLSKKAVHVDGSEMRELFPKK